MIYVLSSNYFFVKNFLVEYTNIVLVISMLMININERRFLNDVIMKSVHIYEWVLILMFKKVISG